MRTERFQIGDRVRFGEGKQMMEGIFVGIMFGQSVEEEEQGLDNNVYKVLADNGKQYYSGGNYTILIDMPILDELVDL